MKSLHDDQAGSSLNRLRVQGDRRRNPRLELDRLTFLRSLAYKALP